MRMRRYVQTSEREVFLVNYYICAFFSVFGLFSLFGVRYSDWELTKSKWAGGLLGILTSFLGLLMYEFSVNIVFIKIFDFYADNYEIICGIITFFLYVLLLVLIRICSKAIKQKKQRAAMAAKKELVEQLMRALPSDPSFATQSHKDLETLKEGLRNKSPHPEIYFIKHTTKEVFALVMEVAPEYSESYLDTILAWLKSKI